MNQINLSCRVSSLNSYLDFNAAVDVLRLDLLHPVVSGNKWFKLKNYLDEAKKENKIVLTFGGAFSNHIVATAAAANMQGLQSVGIIRGEEPRLLSHTLQKAKEFGMKLFFVTRQQYRDKQLPGELLVAYKKDDVSIIPEGGYGQKGMEGAKDILLANETGTYTHIVSAVGTGTTLAGLVAAANERQKVMGISAMKNNRSLAGEIQALLPPGNSKPFELFHEYHFGGYAKHTTELLQFMNDFYTNTGIPTDFVYTAKTFYAVFDLLKKGYFSPTDKILLLHTGGLQGNFSLPKGTLIFGENTA